MKTKNILITVVLCLFFLCCKKDDYNTKITEVIEVELSDVLGNYDKIIIMPGSGCTGCITNAENFFMENVKNKRIKFILTYNFSRKNLALKLNKENIEQPNVLVDDKNIFYLKDYEERIYPTAIIINNGKITNIEMLNY